jgi:molybdenum cofactor cytidylyltransferase
MNETGQPTVVILASGRSERFVASGGQGSKLDALVGGKTVLQHTLNAVKATGLAWHMEDAGHPGMGDSIAAAVRATPDAQGWLILPGDLPMISPQTIVQVAQALRLGAQAAYPAHAGQKGHPVGFAAAARENLLNLKGKPGASHVLSGLGAIELIVNDAGCVNDIDTLAQLQAFRKYVSKQD